MRALFVWSCALERLAAKSSGEETQGIIEVVRIAPRKQWSGIPEKRQRKSAVPVWNRVLERHSARRSGIMQCITENAPTALGKSASRSCAAAVKKV